MGGVIIGGGFTDKDESVDAEIRWTPWKRTFLFLPKKTITGKEILGFAWTRMMECRVREYEESIGIYLAPDPNHIQFAKTKKEIFVHKLKGDDDALVV